MKKIQSKEKILKHKKAHVSENATQKKENFFGFLKQFIVVLGLMYFVLSIPAMAQVLPLPGNEQYNNIGALSPGSTEQQFSELAIGVIQNARLLLGAVAVAIIVYGGAKMVLAQGNEDVYSKQKTSILYAIIGLALVGLSGEIVQIFQVGCAPGQTSCVQGGFLKDPNAIWRQSNLFNQRTQFVITFIKYFIGSVAILMAVKSGMRLITMGSEEDKVSQDKKTLAYSILGLFLIIIADTAVNNVFFKVSPPSAIGSGAEAGIDVAQGVKEIAGLTNIIVSIVSPIAVLALVAAGLMYVASAGNEDKQGQAKRILIAVIMGIIIIYGAFAIVSTFIAGRLEGGSAPITQPTGEPAP